MLQQITNKVNNPTKTARSINSVKNIAAYNRSKFSIQALELTKDYDGKSGAILSILDQYENDLSRNGHLDIGDVLMHSYDKGVTSSIKTVGTKDLILVDISGNKDLIHTVTSSVYCKWQQIGNLFAIRDGEKFTSLCTGKEVSKNQFLDSHGNILPDVIEYSFFSYSTSMLRKEQFFMVNSKLDVNPILDDITYGMWNAHAGTRLNRAKNISLMARPALAMSSNRDLGEIPCIAIYDGKFSHQGVDFFDGGCLMGVNYARQIFTEAFGKDISEIEAYNLPSQIRFSGTGKAFAPVVPENAMSAVFKSLADKFGVVRANNPSKEFASRFMTGEFENKVVVIGEGTPSLILDRNNLKTYVDLTRVPRIKVLDVAKPTRTGLNIQIAQALEGADGFEETFKSIAIEHIDGMFSRLLEQSNKPVSLERVNSLFTPNVLPGISIDYTTKDRAVWNSAIESFVDGLETAINKMKFEVEGCYCRGTGDFGGFFGFRVLEDNQVFIKGIPHGTPIEVTRTPKAGINEHFVGEVLGLDELIVKVEQSDLSYSQKRAVISAYRAMPASVVVVPATDNFKNLTGGSDLDFDAFFCITDPRWIALAKQIPAVEVGIVPTRSETGEEYVFGQSSYRRAFLDSVDSGNESIGIVNNRNTLIVALLNSNMSFDDKLFVISSIIPVGSKETATYMRMFAGDSDIAQVDVDRMVEAATGHIAGEEALIAFLLDCNAAFASAIGRTIDAAKTGEVVKNPLQGIEDIATPEVLGSISIKKNGTYEQVLKAPKTKEGEEKIVLECKISRVQKEVATYAASKLAEIVEPLPLSDEELASLEKSTLAKDISMGDLLALNYLYCDIHSMKSNDNNKKKEVWKLVDSYLANNVRISTKDLSSIDRWKVVKHIALSNKNGARKDGGNAFHTILPEEAIFAVSELYGNDTVAGEIIRPFEEIQDGEDMVFVNGYSDKAICLKPLNGNFVVKFIDGKWYATTKISDAIAITIDGRMIFRMYSECIKAGRSGHVKRHLVGKDAVIMVDTNGYYYLCKVENGVATAMCQLDMGGGRKSIEKYINRIVSVDSVVDGTVSKYNGDTKLKDLKSTILLLTGKKESGVGLTLVVPPELLNRVPKESNKDKYKGIGTM